MDKLVFKKMPPRERREDHPVRLDKEAYKKVKEISDQTRIPITAVLSMIVEFALKYTEVE